MAGCGWSGSVRIRAADPDIDAGEVFSGPVAGAPVGVAGFTPAPTMPPATAAMDPTTNSLRVLRMTAPWPDRIPGDTCLVFQK